MPDREGKADAVPAVSGSRMADWTLVGVFLLILPLLVLILSGLCDLRRPVAHGVDLQCDLHLVDRVVAEIAINSKLSFL